MGLRIASLSSPSSQGSPPCPCSVLDAVSMPSTELWLACVLFMLLSLVLEHNQYLWSQSVMLVPDTSVMTQYYVHDHFSV